MNYCNEQDPEATIVFGGDAIDRGNDGYTIMKELLDNPYIVYLKGNHEDMFCKAAREITEQFEFDHPNRDNVEKVLRVTMSFDWRYAAIQDSISNGGLCTLTDWIMDGMPINLVERVEHLPLTFSYGKCDFCHAAGIYRTFKEAADAEYESKEVDPYVADSLVWSRSALNMSWAPDRIAVFGHTPVIYLSEYANVKVLDTAPLMYLNGGKLDMDTGAVFTGYAYVLNVLTMKAYGFKDTDLNNKEIHKHNVEKIDCIQF